MSKKILLIVAAFIVLLLVAVTVNSKKQEKLNTNPMNQGPTPDVAADTDTHGCIGSQGFSWCESKNICLKVSEDICPEEVPNEIRIILSDKYQKPVEEVKVSLKKLDNTHASGSVTFGEGGPGEGGMFLAVKSETGWELVFDGNGSPDCELLRGQYGFSDDFLIPDFCS